MKSLVLKSSLLLTVGAILSGCNIDGVLSVSQSVNLIDKKGKLVPLQAGRTYKAEVGEDDGKLEFNIKINGKEKKLKLRLPPGQKMPKRNGSLAISSAQSGQPVDIVGHLNTEVDISDDYKGTESCSKIINERVCQKIITKDPAGNTIKNITCSVKPVTVYGKQKIEYHYKTTTQNASVQLLNPASQSLVANFKGSESSTQTIVTWRGMCHVGYGGGGRGHGGGYDDDGYKGHGQYDVSDYD